MPHRVQPATPQVPDITCFLAHAISFLDCPQILARQSILGKSDFRARRVFSHGSNKFYNKTYSELESQKNSEWKRAILPENQSFDSWSWVDPVKEVVTVIGNS